MSAGQNFLMVVNPINIEFYVNDDNENVEFKVLNHYDKTYKFKVFYNQKKYSIVPSEFNIDAKQKVICKVRLLEKATCSTKKSREEIEVLMYEHLSSVPLAMRSLTIKHLPGERPSEEKDDSEKQVTPAVVVSPNEESLEQDSNKKKTLTIIFLGLLLLAILPINEVGTETIIPSIFHISTPFKMICVFIMGVVANQFYHTIE